MNWYFEKGGKRTVTKNVEIVVVTMEYIIVKHSGVR